MMDLAATDATNITTASCGACPSCTELSGGSACFWIVALILGLLSQPGGSLVTEPQLGDWRVWRLSPFLCGLEALTILFALARAICTKQTFRKPILQRVAARTKERTFTLMAARTTTSHDETKPLVEFLGRPKLELILPMVLLFWKALFIRGVPWLTASAVLLWADWALVQFLHCVVWFWPHSKDKPRCHDSKDGRRRNPVCAMEWTKFEEDDISALVRIARMGGTVILSLQHLAQAMWVGYLMGRYYVAMEQAGGDRVILRRSSSRAFGGIFFGSIFWEVYIVMGDLAFSKGPLQDEIPTPTVLRALVSVAEFLGFLIHCKFFYNPAKTYKPDWLDWFG